MEWRCLPEQGMMEHLPKILIEHRLWIACLPMNLTCFLGNRGNRAQSSNLHFEKWNTMELVLYNGLDSKYIKSHSRSLQPC